MTEVYQPAGTEMTASGMAMGAPSQSLTGASQIIFGIFSAPDDTAPVIDLDSTATGTGSTVIVDEQTGVQPAIHATLTDSDSPDFDTGSLTVTYGAAMTANDAFGVIDQGGQYVTGQIGVSSNNIYYSKQMIGTITSSGLGQSLVINFNANATPVGVEALLQQVNAFNASDAPPAGARDLTFTVTDGDGGSSSAVASVTITPVNDAPVIANLDGDSITAFGNNSSYLLDAGANAIVTDVDSADFNNGRLTVTVANAQTGDHTSSLQTGGITGTGTRVSYNGVQFATYTGFGTASQTYTFNANATSAAVQALVRALDFGTTSSASGVRTINYTLVDGDGTANGGQDTVSASSTVRVNPPNTPPTVATNTGSTVLEGGTDTITGVELKTTDSEQSAASLIYTVTSAVTNGTLFRNGFALTINSTFTQADVDAGRITYTHNGGETTSATFGFSVSDGIATVTGQTFNFTVTPVNDAPSGADATIGVHHGMPHVITVGDFGYSDVENDAFTAVTITTVPAAGTGRLLYADDGRPPVGVTAGQIVSVADINAGKLIYKPTPGVNGTATGSFTFQVHDNGGTANGGIDTDQSPNTLTFAVPPNQAPSGSDATIAVQHGVAHVVTLADFGYSDPDGDAFTSVTIDTVPAVGTGRLLFTGVDGSTSAVTANQVISAADIIAGKLVYKPTPGANDTSTGSFTFQVHDNGGSANGGVDTDQSPNTLTFTVPNSEATLNATSMGITSVKDSGTGQHMLHDNLVVSVTRSTDVWAATIDHLLGTSQDFGAFVDMMANHAATIDHGADLGQFAALDQHHWVVDHSF